MAFSSLLPTTRYGSLCLVIRLPATRPPCIRSSKRSFRCALSASISAPKNFTIVRCAPGSPSIETMTTNPTEQKLEQDEPVVSVHWLHANLGEPDVKRSFRCALSASISAPKNFTIVRCAPGSPSIETMTTNPTEQKLEQDEPVVSVHWLHANLGEPDVKVLDASWYMPQEQRNPVQEYQASHIPGAVFFDIDAISAKNTNLPHMLPSESAFSTAVSSLGIRNSDRVVVYDGKGIFSAPRVWWMFRAFGHNRVWVLDGGLPLWRASGYDLESSDSDDAVFNINAASDAVEKIYKGLSVGPAIFEAKLQSSLLWTMEQIRKNIEEQEYQQVDARSKARFDGVAPEPRKGIRSGHIPGSKCVPFPEVLGNSQTLLPRVDLARRFEDEEISLDCPIVASCGTGVTACILALGLYRLGRGDVPIYDGSWTEWALTPGAPVNPP